MVATVTTLNVTVVKVDGTTTVTDTITLSNHKGFIKDDVINKDAIQKYLTKDGINALVLSAEVIKTKYRITQDDIIKYGTVVDDNFVPNDEI